MSECVVFIHGAGLGGWIWDDVRNRLDLPSLGVDLPNRGRGAANKRLTMQDYCDAVVKQIDAWKKDTFILACHSIGGTIGLRVAEHYGDRIAGFVGIGAAIPKNGGSFVSVLPFPQNLIIRVVMSMAGTKPPDSVIRNSLCSGLPVEKANEAVERFTPESKAVYTQRSDAGLPACKKFYIKLTADKEFPTTLQDQMAQNLNASRIISIEAGHLAMISKPRELADQMNALIKLLR